MAEDNGAIPYARFAELTQQHQAEKARADKAEAELRKTRDNFESTLQGVRDEVAAKDKEIGAIKGGKFSMMTHILSKGQRYEMLYKIYKKENELKVYDVELEGISIVKSYSSQYDQFLRKGTPKELLEKMREKSVGEPKELEKKKAPEKDAEEKGAGKEKAG